MLAPRPEFDPAGRQTILPLRAGVVELSLLLPGEEAAALERVARRRGLTLGQTLRGLVREFLDRLDCRRLD